MLNQSLVDTGTRYAGEAPKRRVRPLVPPPLTRPAGNAAAALKTTGRILLAAVSAARDVYVVGSSVFDRPLTSLRRKFSPQIRNAADVRAAVGYTRILGAIPRMPRRRTEIGKAMSSHLDPRGSIANAHRAVARKVLRTPGEHRTILITSPSAGDGKSVCATNLAVVLAQSGRSVLLIDGNLRQPAQHMHFDVQNVAGLIDALRSPAAVRFAIQPSGINNLDVMAAGLLHEDPAELLAMNECKALLVDLTLRYDHILIDAPALGAFDDAALLAHNCDATVLVVRAKHTTGNDATRAMNQLTEAGANIAGVVINVTKKRRKTSVHPTSSIANWQPTPPPQPPAAPTRSPEVQHPATQLQTT